MNQADATVGFLAALLWMTLLLLLTDAGVLLVTHQVMPQASGWGLFGGWLLNLIVIFVLAGWIGGKTGRSGAVMAVTILFAIYALVYGIAGGHIPRAFRLRETPVIPVRDADLDAYRDSDVFHFSDGTVDVKQSATRILTRRGSGSITYYHVAPLVPPDWKPGDLIPAWVGQSGWNEFPPASWKNDLRGGCDVGLDATYRTLALEAIQKHSLKSSRTCPILFWSADPAKEFRKSAYWELGFLLAINLLGFLSLIFPAGQAPKPG
jgi:hypothetical protein